MVDHPISGMLATLVTVLLIGIFATETGYVNSTGHASGMVPWMFMEVHKIHEPKSGNCSIWGWVNTY